MKPEPLKVGDRVAYSRQYLRDTGNFGADDTKRGVVVDIWPETSLALVCWKHLRKNDLRYTNIANLVREADIDKELA